MITNVLINQSTYTFKEKRDLVKLRKDEENLIFYPGLLGFFQRVFFLGYSLDAKKQRRNKILKKELTMEKKAVC